MAQGSEPTGTDAETSTAGGAAAGGGTEFQAQAGAYFAAHLLAECSVSGPLGLGVDTHLSQVWCEAGAAVDDLVLASSRGGAVFVQAKKGLNWSLRPRSDGGMSPLASAVDQFVRQYAAGVPAGVLSDNRRPLDPALDRLVLAVDPSSSAPVTQELPDLLRRIREGLPAGIPDTALPLSAGLRRRLAELSDFVVARWIETGRGEPAPVADILRIMRVVRLDLESEGESASAARVLLANSVLTDPGRATAAWSALVTMFVGLIGHRGGVDRAALQQKLTREGYGLGAVRSFRADIDRLREGSARSLDDLAQLAEIRAGGDVVKIQRPVVAALRAATEDGPTLVVGEAGVGKSGVLHDLAASLREEGRDLVLLPVDRLEAEDEAALRVALRGLEHDLDDVLAEWPGTGPGYLLIDALDAARTDRSSATFRRLIDRLIRGGRRWRVVASIRKFDLRYGPETRRLFSGVPAPDHRDDEFASIRHVDVRLLTDGELEQVDAQSLPLAALRASSPPALAKLLRSPFNLRLLAQLIDAGAGIAELRSIDTQTGLLDSFWESRVICGSHGGDARESVLGTATRGMVSRRRLRVPRNELRLSPGDALRELLSAHVLVEWQRSASARADRGWIAFAHNVLFDYAGALFFFGGGESREFGEQLAREPDLILLLRPSLELHFRRLWELDPSRTDFWQQATVLQRTAGVPEVARVAAPGVAAVKIERLEDFAPLLSALEAQRQLDDVSTAEHLFAHVVGALLSLPDDGRPERLENGPWVEVAASAAAIARGRPRLMFEVGRLLDLLTVGEGTTSAKLHVLSRAAQDLLDATLTASGQLGSMVGQAICYACKSVRGDVHGVAAVLRRVIEPERLREHGHEELWWLAHEVAHLAPVCSGLVADIYVAAFSFRETREDQRPLGGSRILPMTSSVRQDYGLALYLLAEAYPTFFRAAPIDAALACVRVVDGYIRRENTPTDDDTTEFDFYGRRCRVRSDGSCIWAWDESHRDREIEILHHLRDCLAKLDDASGDEKQTDEIIKQIVEVADHAIVWRNLLEAGARGGPSLAAKLAPLLEIPSILVRFDTSHAAGEFLRARFAWLDDRARARVEQTLLGLTDEDVRDRLLGCLPRDAVITEKAKARVEQLIDEGGPPANAKPFTITTGWNEYTNEERLRDAGIDVDADANRPLLALEEPLRAFEQAYLNETPSLDEVRRILPTLQTARETLHNASAADPSQLEHTTTLLASCCASAARCKRAPESHEASNFIREVLLEVAHHENPVPDHSLDETFSRHQSWSPAPRTQAARGLPHLIWTLGESDAEVENTLRHLAVDPVAPVRYQVVWRLLCLYHVTPGLMWEIVEQSITTEDNYGVLSGLLHSLSQLAGPHADRLAPALLSLLRRTPETSEDAISVQSKIFEIMFGLWIWQGRDDCLSELNNLLSNFVRNRQIIEQLILNCQSLAAMPREDAKAAQARHRTLSFLEEALAAAEAILERFRVLAVEGRPEFTSEEQSELQAAWQVADEVCSRLSFAAGTHDERRGGETSALVRPTPAQERLYNEAGTLLDRLTGLEHPRVAHNLMQMLVHFAPLDPPGVFKRVAMCVRNSEVGGYNYESMAANLVVGLVERYLAEQRHIFAEAEDLRRDLLDVLDTFVRAGWPQARRLVFRLSDIF